MSTMSEQARAAAKSKAERLVRTDPHARVDASGYKPDGAMDADVQTGPRPISRRQFRRGGEVQGESGLARADRRPRKASGGALTANSLINRNVKSANEERDGIKHVGGMKAGGAAHGPGCTCSSCGGRVERASGGRNWIAGAIKHPGALHKSLGVPQGEKIPAKKLAKAAHSENPKLAKRARLAETLKGLHKASGGSVSYARGGPAINDGTRPVSGRIARKGGGRTKKGTNVNIIIAPQGPRPAPMAMPPPAGPIGLRQGVAPPVPAGAPPPANMMPVARRSGGKVGEGFGGKLCKPGKYPIESGAGGGLGRLEKAARASRY